MKKSEITNQDLENAVYKGQSGWQAETYIEEEKMEGKSWLITTMKRYNGKVQTTATLGKEVKMTDANWFEFSHDAPKLNSKKCFEGRATNISIFNTHSAFILSEFEQLRSEFLTKCDGK